ncbi:MAG TPA: tripartite tricarboxylate transporter TctB family protein [Burkholderiales bacterium]|nr:tripartite tricarboxylate transporter TctB family protein [Burkholderiales bacterium]
MRRDYVCAALGLAIAGAYWLAADRLPTSLLSDSVGAGGVPKGIAVVLALLSVGVLFARLRETEKQNHLKALGVAAIGFAYVAVVPFLGYFLALTALAGAAALYYGAPRGPGVLAFSLGTAALLWLLFAKLLGIAMP